MVVINKVNAPALYVRFIDEFFFCNSNEGVYGIAPGNYVWRLRLNEEDSSLEFILDFEIDLEETAWCLKWL